MSEASNRLFAHDRGLRSRAAWAGPLVAAAVRFDHRVFEPGSEAVKRLQYLNDSKRVKSERLERMPWMIARRRGERLLTSPA